MIKIGITGSIASGKTTASKILSKNRGPLFSADKQVKKLYKNDKFIKLIINKFNIEKKVGLKDFLKRKILAGKGNTTRRWYFQCTNSIVSTLGPKTSNEYNGMDTLNSLPEWRDSSTFFILKQQSKFSVNRAPLF